MALAFLAVAFASEGVSDEQSDIEPTKLYAGEAITETDLAGEEHKWKKYGYYPVHSYYPRYYAPVYYGKKHFRGRRAADAEVQVAEETDLAGEEHKWKKYSRYYAPAHYYPSYYPIYPSYHKKGYRWRRSVDEETDMTADEHKWKKYGGFYPRYYPAYHPRFYGSYRAYPYHY